jgi:hypothetical protein
MTDARPTMQEHIQKNRTDACETERKLFRKRPRRRPHK